MTNRSRLSRAPRHVPLVLTTRGGLPECVHYGSIAVVDERGSLMAGVGDPRALNFTRSALKPLQALPFVEDGGMERLGFDSQQLALMCASHNGEAVHATIAQRMLAAADADERDLQCGCHVPYFYPHTGTEAPSGQRWSPLLHNCSGKHAGFIAACRLHGQRVERYLDPASPVQQRVRDTVRALAGGREMPMGIDGCSAPNYALPLATLAHAFARLALGRTPALAALAYAMTRHPDLVAGTGRSDLALMQTGSRPAPGDWVAKVGADGVQALGIRSKGIGIVVRIADGNARGLVGDPAVTPLARWARPAIRNNKGAVTGQVLPVFDLPAVRA